MEHEEWRGQLRAPTDVMEWIRIYAKERFTSMNAIAVEALREYKARRMEQEKEARQ